MQKVDSNIVSVTVYQDRASVVREAVLTVSEGESILRFGPLPDMMDPDSLQVSGTGVILRDITSSLVFFDETPMDELKALSDKISALNDGLREIQDRKNHAEAEKNFVDRISRKLAGDDSGKPGPSEFSPDSWIKMVDFYRKKLDDLDGELRRTERDERESRKSLDTLNSALSAKGGSGSKRRNVVDITVFSEVRGETNVHLTYIVTNAGWTPRYDLRAETESRMVSVSYNAIVSQSTEESWDGVAMRLSSARPSISGNVPELSPSWLSQWIPPPPAQAYAARGAAMSPAPGSSRQEEEDGKSWPEAEPMAKIEASIPMKTEQASVETGTTAVTFFIQAKATVPPDGDGHRVTIMMKELPGTFSHVTVPKLEPRAFLRAKVKNETDFPFLPGKTRIFLDGTFVAEASMDFVVPGEEFETSLGVDEAITVEYTRTRKFNATAGIVTKRARIEYGYAIKLKNKRKSSETICVHDQFPVSRHQDILVKPITPDLKKETPDLKKGESGEFIWTLTLAAGEERVIPVEYQIEYPAEMTVIGLA